MNFKEFYEAAKAVDPTDVVSCEVKASRFGREDGSIHFEVFEISMWSGKNLTHFKGNYEAILAQYRNAVETKKLAETKPPPTEVLASGDEAAELVKPVEATPMAVDTNPEEPPF